MKENNYATELKKLLLSKDEYLLNSGNESNKKDLNKVKISRLAKIFDTGLLKLLESNKTVKEQLFASITDGVVAFKLDKFLAFINNREFLPDSYTAYKNKIGLATDKDNYLENTGEVVLNWSYKDCILEGGQDKEDQKRNEVFFNEVLAPDQINRLLEDKIFTNWKRYDKDGENPLDELKDDDNLIIKGNNLVVLHSLLKRFAGKVKLIYIDPPYNTGGDENIFSYNNTFNHSTWLTFMKNRLEVAKKLLRKDGFITIAIDHNELFYLGVLADEIFGRENRLSVITVQHNPKGRNQSKFFSENSEFLFVYARNKNQADFCQVAIDDEVRATFTEQDDDGLFRWENYIRARTVWSREARPENWYPIYISKDLKTISSEKINDAYELYPTTNTGDFSWKNVKTTFDELNRDGYFRAVKEGEKVILQHKYREQQVLKNVWIDKKYQSEFNGTNLLKNLIGKNDFSYPKSLYAVIDIIKIMSSKDDIILDFFGGSGTTAHAVLEANQEQGFDRQFITCEQLDEHVEVMLKRIPKVINDSNFVYAEIKNDAEDFKNEVKNANADKLNGLLEKAKNSSFLSWRANRDKLNNWKDLTTGERKKVLCELVDNNTLYVNYSDIENGDYDISESDKKFNKAFYEV